MRSNGTSAEVELHDNGYGIPADEIETIFEPFKRVDANKQWDTGSGLGLSIVKEYVTAHDGQITVSSEQGVGTMFTVILPLLDANSVMANNGTG